MKILQLVSPAIGGVEDYVFSHYKFMDQEKYRFDFLTQNRGLREAEQFKNFRFDVKLLPAAAAQDKELFVCRVREIFAGGYDVLHLNTCYWTGFLLEELAREAGIRKVIVHAHSASIEGNDAKRREELLRRHEEIKRAFSPDLATDFWACSKKAADWLFGPQIPRDKIRIMNNAIEIERFRFDRQKRQEMRERLGLQDAFVLGTVGRMSYQKNQAFLIDTFAKVYERHNNVRLLIVGDGELRQELEQQIERLGLKDHVLLPGWQSRVEDYLQAMDLFLLPSRFEGFPISLIEAIAAGLPCLVSSQVTDEVDSLMNTCRLPLHTEAWDQWIENHLDSETHRENGADFLRGAGFDVRLQAKELERLYEQ